MLMGSVGQELERTQWDSSSLLHNIWAFHKETEMAGARTLENGKIHFQDDIFIYKFGCLSIWLGLITMASGKLNFLQETGNSKR